MICIQIRNVPRVPHVPSSHHPVGHDGVYILLLVVVIIIFGFWLHSKWYFRKRK